MNDLAQHALDAATATRRRTMAQLAARPTLWLALGGFVTSAVVVVSGSRIATSKQVIPLTSWFGLLTERGGTETDYAAGTIMLVAILLLVGLWVVAVRINRPERCREGQVWTVAAAWSAPFVLGPPLLSNDVYTYVTQGLMQRAGFDVYTHGPSVLGNVPAVAAVNPAWRTVGSPYGPLASVVEHLTASVSGGDPLGALIVFRGLAVVSAVAIGILAADLAGDRRVQALTLTVLNPLLLLQIVSAAHFEGLMCALLLGALLAAEQRRWALAVVLGCMASAVKAPALVVVAALIVVHVAGMPRAMAVRAAARDVLLAIAASAALTLLTPNGLGWIPNLDTPALGHTPFAPASLIGDLYSPIVRSASFDDLATGGRLTALIAAGCICAYLVATAARRELNRTVGYSLIAIGLLGPVLYPWYLLWGIVCLAPTARGVRREWLVILSGLAACVFMPPGFPTPITVGLTVIGLAIAAAILGRRELDRRRGARVPPPAASVAAGNLADGGAHVGQVDA